VVRKTAAPALVTLQLARPNFTAGSRPRRINCTTDRGLMPSRSAAALVVK
jgi:hypothetical protein